MAEKARVVRNQLQQIFDEQSLEIENLQRLIRDSSLTEEKQLEKIEALSTKMKESELTIATLQDNSTEINFNFERYKFHTRAQKVVPLLYAALVVFIADGNIAEKSLYGFAGYGGGAMIENTGYGISKGLTLLKF